MEKPYDLQDLANRLKAKGLENAEKYVGDIYVETKGWAKESAALSENKIDDVIAPFYDQLDPFVLPQIDKIDGKVG